VFDIFVERLIAASQLAAIGWYTMQAQLRAAIGWWMQCRHFPAQLRAAIGWGLQRKSFFSHLLLIREASLCIRTDERCNSGISTAKKISFV
jgi:hypothetical protein